MKKADIGLIGLAVMGENLVVNMESKGFTVAVFNRTTEKVALGMCVTARKLGESSNLICNITLFAILIYELFGPVITKQALIHSGDIQPMSEEVRNRRQIKLENAQKK